MSRFQCTYYLIILGRWLSWLRRGGGGQNWAKVNYIICARSLIYFAAYCRQCEKCKLIVLCKVCNDNCAYASNGDCLHCPKLVQHCTKTGLCNNCPLDEKYLPHTQEPNGMKCTKERLKQTNRKFYAQIEDVDMAGWSPLDNFNISTIF